jgi:hypothetical protein
MARHAIADETACAGTAPYLDFQHIHGVPIRDAEAPASRAAGIVGWGLQKAKANIYRIRAKKFFINRQAPPGFGA